MSKKSKRAIKNRETMPDASLPKEMPIKLSTSANNPLVHIACIVFLVIIVYSNTLNAPFQWDEGAFIVNNPIVKDINYFASPSDAKGFELYGHFIERYIGYLTFALDYRVHGLSVTGYHIVNIAIHIANSVLVYLLVLLTFRTPFFEKSLLKQQSRYIAFFSSVLFAVHPLQTMAVTYVFQRFVPLAGLFCLLSLTAYVHSRLAEDKQQRLFFYCVAFISAVLSMKTKEIAFTLPVVIILYEFLFFRDTLKKRMLFIAPMFLTMSIIPLTIMYLKGTMSAGMIRAGSHQLPGAYGSLMLSRGKYMINEFRVVVTYLRLLFLPVNQNIDYDYPVFKSFFDPQVLLSFIFLAALFLLGVYLAKGNGSKAKGSSPVNYSPDLRLIGFGILWFFIALSVESSIIPLDRLIDEYRVYLPSVGMIIAVVTGAFLIKERVRLLRAGKVVLVMLVLAAGVLSVATYLRNELWADPINLWADAIEKSPGNARAHVALGNGYKTLNMPDKALEQYLIAIKLRPDFAEAHYNLGLIYQTSNMLDRAAEQYLIAIKLLPDYVEAHNNLGNIYQTLNMPGKAIEQYQIALKLRPDAEAHFNFGALYYQLGQMANARMELLEGLKIKPDDQRAQQLLQAIPSQ